MCTLVVAARHWPAQLLLVDGSNDTSRVSGKGPISGTGSKAQRGEGINRFNMKHIISYPVQVSGFKAHHSTLLCLRCVHRDTYQSSCKMIFILPNFSKTKNSSTNNHTIKLPLSNFITFFQNFSTPFISTDKRSSYNKIMHIKKSLSWIKALSENEWMERNMVNHAVFWKRKLQVMKIIPTQNLNMIIFQLQVQYCGNT